MKKSLHALQRYFFVTIFSLASVIGWGQTIIATQDFETTPATPTWNYSNTNGEVSTTNTGTPNNQRIRTGARSFQVNNTSSR